MCIFCVSVNLPVWVHVHMSKLMDTLYRSEEYCLIFCFHYQNSIQDNRENTANLKSIDHHYLDHFELFFFN